MRQSKINQVKTQLNKIRRLKKTLIKLGFIEDIVIKNKQNRVTGHFIKVKFYRSHPNDFRQCGKSDSVEKHKANAYRDNKLNYYKLIQILISEGVKPSAIMVISRFNRKLKDLEQYCGSEGIPTERKAGGVRFFTAHGSKGTESSHVIVMNANSGMYGFPCEIQDSSVMVLAKRLVTENFFEEERRLFYVALTRSKKFIYIYSNEDENSMFLREINPYLFKLYLDTTERWHTLLPEIIKSYIKEIDLGRPIVCPRCHRLLIDLKGPHCSFLGCAGFPKGICNYTYNLENVEEITMDMGKSESKQIEEEKVKVMSDSRYSHLFSDIGLPSIEPVQYKQGVFISSIYFDYETEKAVKFRRAKDSKILWVPKKWLKREFSKDPALVQNIQLKFRPKDLHWK